jgi:hypothetical protein
VSQDREKGGDSIVENASLRTQKLVVRILLPTNVSLKWCLLEWPTDGEVSN